MLVAMGGVASADLPSVDSALGATRRIGASAGTTTTIPCEPGHTPTSRLCPIPTTSTTKPSRFDVCHQLGLARSNLNAHIGAIEAAIRRLFSGAVRDVIIASLEVSSPGQRCL